MTETVTGKAVREAETSLRAYTDLEGAASAATAAHPDLNGIYPLADGTEAFAARAVLGGAAVHTIDVQYYIWHPDLTGTLLFAVLWRAAERGVRVRLLLDDNNTSGLDPRLVALDAHRNIEVRIFNPFRRRRARILDYLFEFGRVNRRMHNKSFTVDGQATIVGGRNVGDEYFGAGQEMSFEDLDVLAVGPLVAEVQSVFERYWRSESAVPFARLSSKWSRKRSVSPLAAAAEVESSDRATRYREAVRDTALVQDILHGKLEFTWSKATLVSDPPSKVLADSRSTLEPVLDRLKRVLGNASKSVDIISPYFVPTEQGVSALRTLSASGVRIRVLTNSLAATDVAAVHAGYARYRRALLAGGVELFELKPSLDGRPNPGKRGRRGGSSGASLHAKAFGVDGHCAYVGSFNFDPRSARLNTEMGVLIENPVVAARITEVLDRDLGRMSYQVAIGKSGQLEWTTTDEHEHHRRYDSEPEASLTRRASAWLLSKLPIEGLL